MTFLLDRKSAYIHDGAHGSNRDLSMIRLNVSCSSITRRIACPKAELRSRLSLDVFTHMIRQDRVLALPDFRVGDYTEADRMPGSP